MSLARRMDVLECRRGSAAMDALGSVDIQSEDVGATACR